MENLKKELTEFLEQKIKQWDITCYKNSWEIAEEFVQMQAKNLHKPLVSGSVCPICKSPIKYNAYDSGLPIQVCSNLDCDWTN